jgi:hypothetical protein
MKINVRLYRVTSVPAERVKAVAGLAADATPGDAMAAIMDEFGPMTPRLKFFWADDADFRTVVVGIEVMGFDLLAPKVPQAGLVFHDPLVREEILMADGALNGELSRIGVYTETDKYEWRVAYEVRGN